MNRRGPALVATTTPLRELRPAEVAAATAAGGVIVDVRPVADFAAAHPAGALSIALRPAFASWLGWILELDRPWILLRHRDQDPEEVRWQALKIGNEALVGELAGGFEAWQAAGAPIGAIPLVPPIEAVGMPALDVRQDSEYAAGHVPGSGHAELGSLAQLSPELAAELTATPPLVLCGHGERAMTAASLLAAAGVRGVRVLDGGAHDIAHAAGIELV
jgi:rhodanese-related sulfurtransferase